MKKSLALLTIAAALSFAPPAGAARSHSARNPARVSCHFSRHQALLRVQRLIWRWEELSALYNARDLTAAERAEAKSRREKPPLLLHWPGDSYGEWQSKWDALQKDVRWELEHDFAPDCSDRNTREKLERCRWPE